MINYSFSKMNDTHFMYGKMVQLVKPGHCMKLFLAVKC